MEKIVVLRKRRDASRQKHKKGNRLPTYVHFRLRTGAFHPCVDVVKNIVSMHRYANALIQMFPNVVEQHTLKKVECVLRRMESNYYFVY